MQNNAVQKSINLHVDEYSTLSVPYVYSVFEVTIWETVRWFCSYILYLFSSGMKGWSHLGCYVASSLSASFEKKFSLQML